MLSKSRLSTPSCAMECTDASNKEQLVICIHWISNINLEVHEDVIGLHAIDNIFSKHYCECYELRLEQVSGPAL